MEKNRQKEIIEKIKETDFFSGFSEEDLSLLLKETSEKKISAGETLYAENEDGEDMFFTMSGLFDIKKYAFPEEQYIKQLVPGEPVGESAFIDGKPRGATVIAAKDSEGLVLTRKQLDTLQKEQPELAYKLLMTIAKTLSLRMREMSQRFVEIS